MIVSCTRASRSQSCSNPLCPLQKIKDVPGLTSENMGLERSQINAERLTSADPYLYQGRQEIGLRMDLRDFPRKARKTNWAEPQLVRNVSKRLKGKLPN